MKFSYFSAFALSLALLGSTAVSSAMEATPHWSYEGDSAPQYWGKLDGSYAACATGMQQSPIDINTGKIAKGTLPPLQFHYQSGPATITNNGHAIQVTPGRGGSITLDNKDYQLVQFHFHAPSEEKINGKPADMVVHLVHKAADGALAVVAVLIETGAENPALAPIFAAMPAQANTTITLNTPVNPATLLPAKASYYHYKGSLTTPPCSEGVSWQIMTTPITLSPQQLNNFHQIYPMNARPVQPLNGRPVTLEP